jgi:hypothetical protein
MIAHILGGEKPCRYASEAAKKTATDMRNKAKGPRDGKRTRDDSEDGSGDEAGSGSAAPSKKRRAIDRVETKQSSLDGKVFKGINIPFSPKEKKAIHSQFLRASISANLPFQWVEDPEVIQLFYMFRAQAGEVIPSAKQVADRLLEEEHEQVESGVKEAVNGKDVVLTYDIPKI